MTQQPASATETGLGIEQGPNRYADTPEAAKGPQIADLDFGTIGRLTDEQCAEIVRASIEPGRLLSGIDGHEESPPDVLLTTVAAIVREHVTAALAEVESRIEAFALWEDHENPNIERGFAFGVVNALRIVRDYREGVGR